MAPIEGLTSVFAIVSQCTYCQHPNLSDADFCQRCGRELWLFGQYRIKRTIGQGGFGRTYLAERADRQPCVVKQFIYQGQSQAKARELFAQEAEQLKRLGAHPQIPALYDYGELQGIPFLIQEYVDGCNLAEEKAKEGCFGELKIRQLLLDLLPVLDYVHQARIIHRDIKPENIIRRSSDRLLVLVDFGASKQIPVGAMVKTGTVIGSLETTAPEQMRGKPVYASDLYSLSITCLRLMLDHAPSDWKNHYEQWVWRELLGNKPFSKGLEAVINRGLAPLAHRYQSAPEMLEALQKINYNSAVTILNNDLQSGGLGDQVSGETGYPPAEKLTERQISNEGVAKYYRKLPQFQQRGMVFALWAGLMAGIVGLIFSPIFTQTQLSADAYWQRATARFNQGDYQGAIADLDRLIQDQPNNPSAYNNRGLAKHNLRDHLGAIADYDRAIQLNPQDGYAFFNRGNARYALADYAGAIADYDSALKLNPKDATAWLYRGNASYAIQNHAEAISDYDRAIALQPQDHRAFFYRANSQLALLNYQKAIADYSQALTLQPDYAPAYFYRGHTYQTLKKTVQAIADFRRAEQLFQQQGDREWQMSAANRVKELSAPQG